MSGDAGQGGQPTPPGFQMNAPNPPTTRAELKQRKNKPRRSGLGIWIAVASVAVVAAAVAGWFWAPFGRPSAPSSLVEATVGPTLNPLATLEAGDCLASFESPWAASFDPVSCAEPHTAQLTAIVPVDTVFDADANASGTDTDAGTSDDTETGTGAASPTTATWPGEDALRERAMLACQSPEAIDLEAAASIPDLEIQVRWPASEAEWDAGVRDYYCFATSSAEFDSLEP